ncbi:MAG: AAA family ATPase [Spirochaetales bacterium]|uniref:AAA family ATPase n=1 Tax=Candidatus Thalassospirochaeta sargassi TaxID=3119039 RepID=A0AAJ1IJI5_9SPIO|nr:AAA family ATPase [Spirochaetales bacterium]
MASINEKSIAVASGKGGVGKTTTCVNLAVYFARSGLKTGLIDLDPLSDAATLLDIGEQEKLSGTGDDFESNIIRVLPNLDLIFPESKLEDRTTGAYNKLIQFKKELENNYDKLILDLPAGSLYEENLIFLEFAKKLVIVTNDEPTSHTASGHYIKQAHAGGNEQEYLLWHNKYAGITVAGFDPGDLPGNYNKNVAEEDRFNFDELDIKDAAFIPHDPAMDLLQSNPSLSVNILAQMSERLDFLIEQRIDELAYSISLPGRSGGLIRHYLHLNPYIRNIEISFNKLSEYIFVLLNTKSLTGTGAEYHQAIINGAVDVFSDSEKDKIITLLDSMQNDPLLTDLLKSSAQLKIAVDDQNNSTRLFFSRSDAVSLKAVDKRVSLLLQKLHTERNNHNPYIKSTAGLLLFDFALYKLLASKTVTDLIIDFIPVKKNKRGEESRDKHSQILQLVNEEESYKKDFLRLIDVLFPVVLKQVAAVVETFNIAGLIFNNSDGVQKDVYLKLLSAFLHNSINSGLGIIVGFPFRPASAAFEKAAAELI